MSLQEEHVAARRAEALRELGILGMPAKAVFNGIVTLASAICGRPMAAISLTDVDRQWLLSEVGVGTDEIPLGIAFCRHGLNPDRIPMDIPDAREDERFKANPLVTGEPGIRSYTGVPIVVDDDIPIGMLCVLAPEPGQLDTDQMQALSLLAALASDLLRAHKAADDLEDTRRERDVARGLAAEAARRAHAVFAGVPTPFVVTDADGVVLQTNPAFDGMTGNTDEAPRNYLGLLMAAERESEHLLLHDLWRTERDSATRETTLVRADGSELPVLVTSTVARDADGLPHSILNRVEDISMRRQAEIELRESQSAIDGIVTIDRRRHIVSWNDGAARLLGYSRADAVGRHIGTIFPPADGNAGAFASFEDGGDPQVSGRTLELEAVTADGSRLPIELSLSRWERRDQPFYTAVFRDITERRRQESHQLWLSTHDETTGLGNLTALRQWHEDKVDDEQALAIFSLRLLNLDTITTAFGAEVARNALEEVGVALAALNDVDLEISHLGDALFVGAGVLSGPVDAPDDELMSLAQLVTEAANGPFVVAGTPLELQVQIGAIAAPKRDADLDELLRQAEATRTRTPRRVNIGSGAAVDPDTGTSDLVLTGEMRPAVAEDQLELHYQPITRLQPMVQSVHLPVAQGCSLPTVEALVRWRHPERGLLGPNSFIPLIETGPMITLLTEWVLRTALRQQQQWQHDGWDAVVAVNLSAQVLLNDDVLTMVRTALDESGADPTRLKIEITESAIVADPDETRDIVLNLRGMGVGVSLDDFGTGYTSLKLLRDLPVDEIKLDRLFVANATTSPADAAIANAVSQLAHRLAIRTVAEGIEDDETLSLFRALGYDYVQGYVISRPMPVDDATAWLKRNRLSA